MKKKVLLGLVLVAALAVSGCGFLGNFFGGTGYGSINGTYYTDGALDYLYLSGFPSGSIYEGYSYNVGTGSKSLYAYYSDYSSGTYYPGNAFASGSIFPSSYTGYVYKYSYTVSNYTYYSSYYSLYLYYDGMYTSGVDSTWDYGAQVKSQPIGSTKTYTLKNGLEVSVTKEIVKLSPEEFAALNPQIQSK